MHPKPILLAILAAGALALGTAGIARAHDAAPVDEQCGAEGEQLTETNDDVACGADEDQTGDQGDKQNGQPGDDAGEHED
jgi:hypothetical protein